MAVDEKLKLKIADDYGVLLHEKLLISNAIAAYETAKQGQQPLEVEPMQYIPKNFYPFLQKLKELAFSMPAPNPYTPQFVQLAIEMAVHVSRPEPVSVSLSEAYHSEKLIGLVENHDGTWASLKEIAQEVLDRVGVKYVD